jgi:hypothetical protein
MAVESEKFTALADEFALVAETAAEAGAAGSALPQGVRSARPGHRVARGARSA